MAHEVENMFSVNETPWHNLGRVLHAAPSTADAIRMAGLDWTVNMRPLMTSDATPVDAARAVVRSSDGRVLGVVGSDYHPLQNAEAFSFFDPFIASGEATLETAGSLREGSRVWILAKLSRDPSVIVKGDEVLKFILLANSHDGTMAIRVGFTPIRVVCANTLALADSHKASKLLKIKHHKGAATTLEAVRDVMNTANACFEATADQYRFLASRRIVDSDLAKYVKAVFRAAPPPSTGLVLHNGGATPQEKPSRVLDTVKRLLETGRGAQLPGVKGTLWGAYNAVTEYVAYERGSKDDVRVDHTWFGTGAQINDRALKMAMAMANAG